VLDQLKLILTKWFEMPLLPASVLLSVVLVYWIFVMLGTLDIELFDWDFDVDTDVDIDVGASIWDVGLVPAKFLNLGSIPVMFWGSIYSLSSWLLALGIQRWAGDQENWMKLVEAFGLGLVATKVITNPMRKWFEVIEPNRPQDILGNRCTITTLKATDQFGEASFATGGAPLILTVRTLDDESLAKGTVATIVDYNAELNTYYVRGTQPEG